MQPLSFMAVQTLNGGKAKYLNFVIVINAGLELRYNPDPIFIRLVIQARVGIEIKIKRGVLCTLLGRVLG